MRKANVYRNGELVGSLTEENGSHYIFEYDNDWYRNKSKPAVSLTLPKSQKKYESKYLFPFFYNMLSEGVNKKLQCTQLKIDERDSFGLLMATSQFDTIGAITIKPDEQV
jgi:HipA-like protein